MVMTYAEAQAARAEELRMSGGGIPLAYNTNQYGEQTPAPSAPDANYSVLQQLLAEFGLSNIQSTVQQFIASDASAAEIQLQLRDVPEYRQRFSVIFEREEAGLPPVSPAEVVEFERQLGQVFSMFGVPERPGENLQTTAAQLLGGDVSMAEVQERLAAQQAFGRRVLEDPNMDQEVVSELLQRGVTPIDVANFAIDPTFTLEDVERRLAAAEIANEASRAQYRVQAPEALDLARQGLTGEQARQGFGVLTQQRQVVDRLAGESEDPVTREQELAALTGDVQAQAAIERSAQRRVAAATVGGSFVTDDEGFGGLR